MVLALTKPETIVKCIKQVSKHTGLVLRTFCNLRTFHHQPVPFLCRVTQGLMRLLSVLFRKPARCD